MFHKFCILNGHTTTHCKLTVGQSSEHNVVSGLHLANFVFRVPSVDSYLSSNFDQFLFFRSFFWGWGFLAHIVRAKRVLVIKTIPRYSFVLSALDQWRSLLSLLFIVRSSTKMDIHYVVCVFVPFVRCVCVFGCGCDAVVAHYFNVVISTIQPTHGPRLGRRERRRVQRFHIRQASKNFLSHVRNVSQRIVIVSVSWLRTAPPPNKNLSHDSLFFCDFISSFIYSGSFLSLARFLRFDFYFLTFFSSSSRSLAGLRPPSSSK